MKLLKDESPILVLPTLAAEIGLNEAIILQQIHFRLLYSENRRDGYQWVYKSYEDWRKKEFPFWSVDTIRRTIWKLEKKGYLISTNIYNRMKIDKTKWYRINYDLLATQLTQNAPVEIEEVSLEKQKNAPSSEEILPLAITKDFKTPFKEKIVEDNLDVVEIMNYLNDKAQKQYKITSKTATRLITARFREGYTVTDFKNMIDFKVADWQGELQWEKYLRPSTLFNATNFENYLEEARQVHLKSPMIQEFEIDMTKGEW